MRTANNIVAITTGLLLALTTVLCDAETANNDAPDLDYRMGKIDIRYTINADGSFIENRAWEMTVLKESALEESKTQRIAYSTSIETSDIIEAYTRKPDGKRIDVPKDNF